MAKFDETYAILEDLEGFYTVDTGGQTWKGVARRFWPAWGGWPIIDRLRDEEGNQWVSAAKGDDNLELFVQDFYKEQFWNRIQGERISDQDIANELMEQAVNMGVHKAVLHLQKALNLLVEGGSRLTEDGLFGEGTLCKLNLYLHLAEPDHIHALLGVMNIYQGWHYITLASNPDTGNRYKKYLRGWVNRRVEV